MKKIDEKVIYPELSYNIVGMLFNIYNNLGYGYREKHYQKALEEELIKNNIPYKKELSSKMDYNNKTIARYFLDFLIEDKIVLEIKVADDFYRSHISQILSYLKSTGLKLGILAIFTPEGIKTKRILN